MTARVTSRLEQRGDAGAVGYLTIDNQSKLNCVGLKLIEALRDGARAMAGEPALRAVVLTGAGPKAFVGGADIGEMLGHDRDSARHFIATLQQANAALRAMPVPVIARINGYCLGAGLEIAASCDMRIAVEDARFGMPEVRVGLPSVIEAALLPGLIGWGKARELLLTGRMIDAGEALASGLIERLAPAAALDAGVEDWLEGILASGPRAIRAQKALIAKWEGLALEEAIAAGIDALADAHLSDEPKSMMDRFVNRRRR